MPTASVTNIFAALTLIESSKANQNFQDLVSFINTNVIQKDASVAFTAVPSGPATDPISDNQFARKAYVDKLGATAQQKLTGDNSHTVSELTDMALNNVSVIANNIYGIHLHSSWTITGDGRWDIYARVNGSDVGRLFVANANTESHSGDGWVFWTPSVTASTDDITVYASEVSGTATFKLEGSAASPRTLTLVNFGAL